MPPPPVGNPGPGGGDGDGDGDGCQEDADGDGKCDCEDADGDGQCDYCEDADEDGECDCDEVDDDGACACEDADGDGECDPPGVRIEPGSREYYIDTSERMPRMEFQARMSNADAFLKEAGIKFKDVWFKWKLEMAYDDTDDDGIFDYEHKIPPGEAPKKVMGTGVWRPDWGTLVSGAKTVTVSVEVGTGDEEPTAEDTQTGYTIMGRNPSRAQIASGASSPWYFRKIVRAESSCRQFDDGYPLKSGDNGYGLMQITNPRPTEAHIWRWTRNLAKGKEILDGKIASAGRHWDRVEEAWKKYNEDNDPDIPAPPNKTYKDFAGATVTFGYDTGHPLKDGIAIKKYNGTGCGPGAPDDCESGEWLDWTPKRGDTPPKWEYNEGRGYVDHLVEQQPCE